MKHLVLLASLALSGVASAASIDPPTPPYRTKTFNNPKIDGIPLDICLTWAQNCGKPAADDFCAQRDYDYASSYQINANSGHTKLPNGQICEDTFCDSFSVIVCKKEM